MCVLASLIKSERYGYELSQHLQVMGLGRIKGGTLYPLLARLEKAGHVTTQWRQGTQGPGRKYYSLTESGRFFLDQQTINWNCFTSQVSRILELEGKGNE